MDVRALDPALQQSAAVGLGSILPQRPQSIDAATEVTSQRQTSNGVVLMEEGAEE